MGFEGDYDGSWIDGKTSGCGSGQVDLPSRAEAIKRMLELAAK